MGKSIKIAPSKMLSLKSKSVFGQSKVLLAQMPGRIAQSVGHLTHKSGVLGSIPGLATYFRFSFHFFQEGQLSVTGESMCTKYWLTA